MSEDCSIYVLALFLAFSLFLFSRHMYGPSFLCHTAAVAPSHTLSVSKKCNPSLTYLQVDFSDF